MKGQQLKIVYQIREELQLNEIGEIDKFSNELSDVLSDIKELTKDENKLDKFFEEIREVYNKTYSQEKQRLTTIDMPEKKTYN